MPFEHQSFSICVIFIHFCYTLPRTRFPHRGFEVIFAILEAGYYTPDLHQDTQFLLSALSSRHKPVAACAYTPILTRRYPFPNDFHRLVQC